MGAVEPVREISLVELAKAYGLPETPTLAPMPEQGINNSVLALRCGADEVVLKLYQSHSDPATICYEHALLHWLKEQQLPFAVPTPLATQQGATYWPTPVGLVALFPKLPGTLARPATLAQLGEVGMALACLHRTLAGYGVAARAGWSGFDMLDQIHPSLPQPERIDVDLLGLAERPELAEELASLREEIVRTGDFLAGSYRLLPRQVIHGDFAPSNTLFEQGRLTAVLDFEMAMPDVRAIDVASGLIFSMRLWENQSPWAQADAFCQGYGRVQKLTQAEVAALPALMALLHVVSTIWWFGRGLAGGDVTGQLWRLGRMRSAQTWRAAHGDELVARAEQWLC
jgi:homoserine kinase type II